MANKSKSGSGCLKFPLLVLLYSSTDVTNLMIASKIVPLFVVAILSNMLIVRFFIIAIIWSQHKSSYLIMGHKGTCLALLGKNFRPVKTLTMFFLNENAVIPAQNTCSTHRGCRKFLLNLWMS